MGNSHGKPVVFTDEVNLNHFRLLRVVGKGAFGKVRIVERKDSGLTFALKYIRKDEVVRSESVRNIIRERRMLEHLNHPFLCNLRYSFQDIEYLYIVVDLMNGGDLRFHISRKTFTEEAVRFWMAELGCALRYIHQQGIIHRDVKPDNILLDSQGHLHLADFNVASEYRPDKKLHSKSGTLAYLAPEVYAGTGYLNEVDWWSLGVVFYECIYNKVGNYPASVVYKQADAYPLFQRPFSTHGHEKLEKEIRKGIPNYPVTQPPVSMPCLHAISSLLEKDKRKRIGAAGFETFSDNPFFRPIDFRALERKEVAPIFIPSSEKTNFDATYDLEELLLEEAPLEARARRQKPRGALKEDATDKEIRADELHRMIETMFEPFDYTLVSGYTASRVPDCPEEWEPPPTESKSSDEDKTTSRNSMQGSPPPGHHLNSKTSTHSEYYPTHEHRTDSPAPPIPSAPSTAKTSSPSPHAQRVTDTRSTSVATRSTSKGTSKGARSVSKGTRSTSKGGGVQVTVGATGSWAQLNDLSATLPADCVNGTDNKHHGILGGLLGRKKGRDRSPKPHENGVLGKEGARVVINSGGR